ncbi:hypothetical protein BJ994_002983 [Arthrobacter pigmenti]|uniref:DUF3626 domain-containing protein n=1 Tax=Arthrobacter pigmenti TaxID=271432 RepID=A0A846RUT0_9MICC|nr:DUF3626 domain-containing protein [Arthrobacter pigmenti]NJC23907.1 hypothetical protein [Arthrobacter pigmenti]
MSSAWEDALDFVRGTVSGPPLDPSLAVTLHFHPDRMVGDTPLLGRLASDPVYRSQFETGTSNGGLTGYPGGDRWHWEDRMFGGAYNSAPAAERPKYGSLNYRHRSIGGSARFGSSHFRLAQSELGRTTFCYPDSSTLPSHFGTAEHIPLIQMAEKGTFDVLDDHIEAHVHGPLRLGEHLESLVLDPSYRGTLVEDAARTLPIQLAWHEGFRLHVDELQQHVEYRGAEVVAAGLSIAVDGWLDPRIVGEAAKQQRYDGQTLKRVWHCVARFGYRWGK